MSHADLVRISQAARSLGVPTDVLESKAELGAVPEAVRSDTDWMIPTAALARIADREGWTLDLTGVEPRTMSTSDRATTETMAAQAAVMLAKTQASAAQVEAQDLLRRLRVAQQAAQDDRERRVRAEDELAAAERELADLQRAKAVAEAQADELRRYLDREQAQFRFMSERVVALEQERDQLLASLSWSGRRRYRQLVESACDSGHDPQPGASNRLRDLAESQLRRSTDDDTTWVEARTASRASTQRDRSPNSGPPPPPPPRPGAGASPHPDRQGVEPNRFGGRRTTA